jgi:3-oxoacyl-[acyl-carrier-protein] synthase II
MNRVVITGAGIVSPIGSDFMETISNIESGKKGIGLIGNFNTDGYPVLYGAEVKENGKTFSNPGIDRKEIFLNKVLEEISGNNPPLGNYLPPERILNIGMGIDYFNIEGYSESPEYLNNNWQKYSHNTNFITRKIAERYSILGGYNVNVSACVASSQSIGFSYRMIKNSDEKKIVITGGVDSMLNPLHYMGFHKLGALSDWNGNPEEACRPFDKKRCGLVLGEGAAIFTLEDLKNASQEKILAEIAGYGSTMDAYMVTDPEPEGKMLAKAAALAIGEAGITPDDIDCVHCHGTGTLKNDPAESKALYLIFGERYKNIPVFSLKAQVGHLIAACGAMEMAGVLYSILHQAVPVTANYEFPDPDVPLFVVKDKPLLMNIKYVLKLNAAFGGQNTAIVVKKYE